MRGGAAVPNTLGLDTICDPDDLVLAVESAFSVKFRKEEAEAIVTVGQMFDLLVKKIARGAEDRKCASAMAFYRLRRALAKRAPGSIRLSPSSDLSWLTHAYTKRYVRRLERETGLKLPKPVPTQIANFGSIGVIMASLSGLFLVLLAAALAASNSQYAIFVARAGLILLPGGGILGMLTVSLDPGRLPKDCERLRDLSRKATKLSYAVLIDQGADASEKRLWQMLVDVLSDFAHYPAVTINRDTLFIDPCLVRPDH